MECKSIWWYWDGWRNHFPEGRIGQTWFISCLFFMKLRPQKWQVPVFLWMAACCGGKIVFHLSQDQHSTSHHRVMNHQCGYLLRWRSKQPDGGGEEGGRDEGPPDQGETRRGKIVRLWRDYFQMILSSNFWWHFDRALNGGVSKNFYFWFSWRVQQSQIV